MTAEFPPPDPRLAGKVTILKLEPNARLRRKSGDHCIADLCDTRPDAELESTADVEINRLAKLATLEYERQRKEAAERLDIRASILDRLVAAERAKSSEGGKQGRALSLPEPEPWPRSVNGADLLDQLSASIRRHVVMHDHVADTAALWVVHTYLVDCFGTSPRLAITSPEKGCGKTTALDVLSRLVSRPLPTTNASASAIFRLIEMQRPTLLIDEADTFLPENEELRGILNSGHRQGAFVIRTVGEEFEPRWFSTYAPCAVALIGKLPPTLADRSVSIELRRRRSDEPIEPFRFDRTQHLDQLARKVARWAADNAERLRRADPEMPVGVFNRVADNWRPLLALADAAMGEWPRRARRAIQRAAETGHDEQSVRELLLADIRAIFAERGVDRLPSAELAEALVATEGRPWAEWRAGKPISANGVARLLARFNIVPDTIRVGDRTPKGYQRARFDDAFQRYLPPGEFVNRNNATTAATEQISATHVEELESR
jgi:putative DNA primase/helicase